MHHQPLHPKQSHNISKGRLKKKFSDSLATKLLGRWLSRIPRSFLLVIIVVFFKSYLMVTLKLAQVAVFLLASCCQVTYTLKIFIIVFISGTLNPLVAGSVGL